jgi:2-oxoisovalerate dehydrogenase E1 component
VVTYGLGVIWAQNLAEEIEADIDIIDLRTLAPIDYETIVESLAKTGRVLILHEATLTGGIGAELAAYIGQHYFEMLDAPIIRSASLDTPVPFAKDLEALYLPPDRFKQHLLELLSF